MSDNTTPTTEEQLQQLSVEYNVLSRKYRLVREKLSQVEDAIADLQARAELQIQALQQQLAEPTKEEVVVSDEVLEGPVSY